MIGEIIAIGDELTSGRVLNTTSGFAARKLFEAGHTIQVLRTIGDAPALIGEALLEALDRADFVIVTGGLGSTDDDITNEAVSRALNRPTMPDLRILAWIREHLRSNRIPPDNPLEKLAWLPDGAEPFDPDSRMAGYLLVHEHRPIFFLPGVPEEMRDLLDRAVLPRLAALQQGPPPRTRERVYKVFGMAESEINRVLAAESLPAQVSIGYYPVFPDVHVSVTMRGHEPFFGEDRFSAACAAIERLLGGAIYGVDDDELETVVGRLLLAAGLTLAAAESCSGGLLGHRITRVVGSSRYFLGGVVAYANRLKQEMLGVDQELLERCGAVSREVAAAMAAGVRRRCGSDLGIALTGIAGPDGGSPEKPVGTIFVGISGEGSGQVHELRLKGERNRIQEEAAHSGLNLLRIYLQEIRRGFGPR